ncbi:MAG TPA: ATP-binding cassette domain-containing protein [Mycobacteriales bacterium]|jgi:ABC-type sugar transport system ATPase subunit|nr:ATP-binding cassette domain-containing protein [Mycobacteriales bacterium]
MATEANAEARSQDRASALPTKSKSAKRSESDTPLLRLSKIGKSFGPVQALSDVDLEIYPGEVLALVGDNGAGKSTIIKTISGIWSPDAGEMFWEGKEVHVRNPRDAAALGIATMYQDLALADNLDIVQNMFLGREVLRHLWLDETAMELSARKTLADLSVTTVRSIRQPVGTLSGGQRQAVAVARAVLEDAKLVIMDEPTAALGVSQTAMVLKLVKRLSERGVAVLIVSHNLVDVFEVADRLAALYLGRIAGVERVADIDTQRAVELITTGKLAQSSSGKG